MEWADTAKLRSRTTPAPACEGSNRGNVGRLPMGLVQYVHREHASEARHRTHDFGIISLLIEKGSHLPLYAFRGDEYGVLNGRYHIHALLGNVGDFPAYCGERLPARNPGDKPRPCCGVHSWPGGYARVFPYDPAGWNYDAPPCFPARRTAVDDLRTTTAWDV